MMTLMASQLVHDNHKKDSFSSVVLTLKICHPGVAKRQRNHAASKEQRSCQLVEVSQGSTWRLKLLVMKLTNGYYIQFGLL